MLDRFKVYLDFRLAAHMLGWEGPWVAVILPSELPNYSMNNVRDQEQKLHCWQNAGQPSAGAKMMLPELANCFRIRLPKCLLGIGVLLLTNSCVTTVFPVNKAYMPIVWIKNLNWLN